MEIIDLQQRTPPSRVVPIEAAIERLRRGQMLILVDDERRENEGDLILAAEHATAEAINFMARYGRGLVCLALTHEKAAKLRLTPMVQENTSPFQTGFTVSIDAKRGTTTGISAADRAETIRQAVDERAMPEHFSRPGHIFPLVARDGGVLVRPGQTEGSVDLMRLAGLTPAAVICEVMNDDGTMARLKDLERFAAAHDLAIVTVADLVRYRLRHERIVERDAVARLPTSIHDAMRIYSYRSIVDAETHVAVVTGDIAGDAPVLTRIHSECFTGDVFGSLRCDCRQQLTAALECIAEEGRGALLYIRQEGRGIGLHNKLRAYALQDQGLDTVEANRRLGFGPDLRNYGIAAQMLGDLGIRRIRLMTNNPQKIAGLEEYGMAVVERVPLEVAPSAFNREYLKAKRDRLGHWLHQIQPGEEPKWP